LLRLQTLAAKLSRQLQHSRLRLPVTSGLVYGRSRTTTDRIAATLPVGFDAPHGLLKLQRGVALDRIFDVLEVLEVRDPAGLAETSSAATQ
jgi:hypothetical protein